MTSGEATELAYPDAMGKVKQIHEHLEKYNSFMSKAHSELQALVDNQAASGQFMIRFGEIWNEHSGEMYKAYQGLTHNTDACKQNYDRINHVAGA